MIPTVPLLSSLRAINDEGTQTVHRQRHSKIMSRETRPRQCRVLALARQNGTKPQMSG